MNAATPDTVTPFPIRLLTAALVLTVSVLVAMGWSAYDSYRNFVTVQLHDLRLAELRGIIVHLDEVLTMSARMAATTGDQQWERRYRDFEPALDAAVKETMKLRSQSASAEAAKETDNANAALVEMENRAFVLARAGQTGEARKLLFSAAYEKQKTIYAAGTATLIEDIKAGLANSQRDMLRRVLFFGASALVSAGLLVFTWLTVLRRLHQWRVALAQAGEALRLAHEDLEKRVVERTRELQAEVGERRRSEAQLAAAQSIARIGSWEWDVLANKLVWSDQNYRIHGLEPCESGVTYESALELVHVDDRPTSDAAIQNARRCGLPFNFEQRVVRRDGTGLVIHQRGEAVLGPDDRVVRLVGTAQDITELKHAEEELEKVHKQLLDTSRQAGMAEAAVFARNDSITALKQAQEEVAAERARFKFIFESVPVGIALVLPGDEDHYFSNPAHGRITGLATAELALPGAFDRVTHPDDLARQRSLTRSYKQGEIDHFTIEKRYLRPSGEIVWASLTRRMYTDPATGLKQSISTLVDITDRKRAELELSRIHSELLEVSRQAGMAEVATGVLHNVGNVLNSVNVSATVVIEQVRASKAGNLLKLGAMLRAHEGDLAEFLLNNPKGRRIPTYLITLAEQIASEHAAVTGELGHLRKNIEHIKDIVAMQQSYARVSGVAETVAISELVEDALRMNASALARHGLDVVREYEPDLPPATLERHKVLQVLVNLIRNAKHACDDSGRADKRMILRITRHQARIRAVVIDNGIGIPPENLTRIFAHGFTTKKDGHGFGLHSGALVARELGGTLIAHSEGHGQGATFTLELPLNPAPANPSS